jgi:hypothetical protein
LWLGGPRWWQQTWKPFVDKPKVTRALGVLGLGFGLWLAWREEQTEERTPDETPRPWSRRLAEVMQ